MTNPSPIPLGEYRGFEMTLHFDTLYKNYVIDLKGELSYSVVLSADELGNIIRLDNALDKVQSRLEKTERDLVNTEKQFETAKMEVQKAFPQEEELTQKQERLAELDRLLDLDKVQNEIVSGEVMSENEQVKEQKAKEVMER